MTRLLLLTLFKDIILQPASSDIEQLATLELLEQAGNHLEQEAVHIAGLFAQLDTVQADLARRAASLHASVFATPVRGLARSLHALRSDLLRLESKSMDLVQQAQSVVALSLCKRRTQPTRATTWLYIRASHVHEKLRHSRDIVTEHVTSVNRYLHWADAVCLAYCELDPVARPSDHVAAITHKLLARFRLVR